MSADTYVELFNGLQTNNREIPLIRDNYLHIWTLKPINDDKPLNGFVGTIFKRNSLPSDWYNTEKKQEILMKILKVNIFLRI